MYGKAELQSIITSDPERTRKTGEALGRLLGKGDIVALAGPLGAGKTVFAKGIAKGLGVMEEVTSPSFNIVIEYKGRLPVYHVDFYRLSAESEAIDVGAEEYIYGDGVTILEWADRFPGLMPEARLDVEINFGKRNKERILAFAPLGIRMKEITAFLIRQGGSRS